MAVKAYVFVCERAPGVATVITQVTMLVVVCCILHCGSIGTSVVTVVMQTNFAPAKSSVLGSFLSMEAETSTRDIKHLFNISCGKITKEL